MSEKFKRINHPLTIRKARGKLIINVNSINEPITVIRQTRSNELEVHLRDGSVFTEKFSLKDLQSGILDQTILEMSGMVEYLVFFSVSFCFHGIDEPRSGKISLVDAEDQLDYVNELVKLCYPPNSYVDKYVTKINSAEISQARENMFKLTMTSSIMCRDDDIEQLVQNLSLLCHGDTDYDQPSIIDGLINMDETFQSFRSAQEDKDNLSYHFKNVELFGSQISIEDSSVFYGEK